MSERMLAAEDVPAAAALLARDPCWRGCGERPGWILDMLARGESVEHAAIGSFAGDELRAYVSFNFVAGAEHTAAVSCVARSDESSGIVALSAALKELSAAGARLIVAEIPDTASTREYVSLLRLAGFELEAGIGDYYADGVAMNILVARPGNAAGR